jgi:hypothetical protein
VAPRTRSSTLSPNREPGAIWSTPFVADDAVQQPVTLNATMFTMDGPMGAGLGLHIIATPPNRLEFGDEVRLVVPARRRASRFSLRLCIARIVHECDAQELLKDSVYGSRQGLSRNELAGWMARSSDHIDYALTVARGASYCVRLVEC